MLAATLCALALLRRSTVAPQAPARHGDLGVDVNADVDAFGKDQMGSRGLLAYAAKSTVHALPLRNLPSGDHARYWDDMVEQYQAAGIDFVAVWLKGNGQPATFGNLVAALRRRGLTRQVKVMPFDDNPASWTAFRNHEHGQGYGYAIPFDVADRSNWAYVWDRNLRPFFESVPDAHRYKIGGRPVYRIWSASPTFLSNVKGNGSRLLVYLRERCRKEFGFDPYIMVPEDWVANDPSSDDPKVVDAVAPWFTPVPGPAFSTANVRTWRGVAVGACVPQFRISNDADPNSPTWVVDPRHGRTLAEGLAATVARSGVVATFVEGFDDYWENATLWRARNLDPAGRPLGYDRTFYDYPNHRINLLRRFSRRPFPTDLKEEAENCDSFAGAVPILDRPNAYRNGDLAVEETADEGGGYAVCRGRAGESLTWREVPMQGAVHLRVRITTAARGGRMHFVVDGVARPSFAVPRTSGGHRWATVSAGGCAFSLGSRHTVTLVMDTAGIDVNWWGLTPSPFRRAARR